MFSKKHPPVGARPGTLVIDQAAKAPRIRVIDYTAETIDETEIADLDVLAEYRDRESVTWIDVQGLGDEEILRGIADIFSIHPLALEDVVNVPQRPKAETYDHQELYITRMAMLHDAHKLETEQIGICIGSNYVLTFQERHGDILDPVRQRVRRGKGPMRENGSDYLAYAIIDTIVDGYYPVIEAIGDYLEELEDEVVSTATKATLRKVYGVKRDLLALRRAIWPQREALGALVRDDNPFITDPVRVYLRDTQDHAVQIADVVETYREMAAGLMDVYMSSLSNRMNEVMKVLTMMASIFIPLSFLAGLYGMNFEHMPELHYRYSYPVLLAAMVTVAAGMVVFFFRRGWIGGRDDGGDESRLP